VDETRSDIAEPDTLDVDLSRSDFDPSGVGTLEADEHTTVPGPDAFDIPSDDGPERGPAASGPSDTDADASGDPDVDASPPDVPEAGARPEDAPEGDLTVLERPLAVSDGDAEAGVGETSEAPDVEMAGVETLDAPPAVTAETEPAEVVAPLRVRRSMSAEIARQLHALGARFCFMVPGESFLPLIDDLSAAGIRVVTTRIESSAAFMAASMASSTGRPQIVAASRAVGAANAAIGIHAASQDSAPLIALVGQVERELLGREAFQEADLVRSIGTLATWAVQLDDPEQVTAILAKLARRLHAGRPGPVLLSLPEDALSVEIEVDDTSLGVPSGPLGPAADRREVRQVMRLLASSERGVVVAGGGVLRARASKRLVALSEALAVPVIAAWRRPDVFPNDHPNYLGMAGPWSAPSVHQRLLDADVVVFVGARPSETTTFGYSVPAPSARWVQVDLQPHSSHAGLPAPALLVEADASRFLDAAWSDLRGAALDNEMRARREARGRADREAYRAASRVGQGSWDGPGVHPGRLVETLRDVLPDNAVIATDAGNMGGWLARGYRFRRPGTFIGTASGAMGYGLPAAIAASLQDPDRIAVAFCGDGGLAMTIGELETSVREGAHPVVIVLDDQRYGTIAMHQAREGRPAARSDLGPIDFAAVARAHGALGFTIADDAEFEPALREAIGARQTALLHVILERAWVSVDDHP
jgi:acetolactate synthase I/II/III large subunit